MTATEIRDEEPPDDAVVVIRGGLHSLDVEKVIEVCEDSFVDFVSAQEKARSARTKTRG